MLLVDGEPRGGEFDDIGARSFSPDGQSVAHVGRRRNKFIVVLDEKEGTPFDIVGGIGFSSDSRRFAYAGADVNRGFRKQKAVGRATIDGTAGPTFEERRSGRCSRTRRPDRRRTSGSDTSRSCCRTHMA
jgi:hypothetical protein